MTHSTQCRQPGSGSAQRERPSGVQRAIRHHQAGRRHAWKPEDSLWHQQSWKRDRDPVSDLSITAARCGTRFGRWLVLPARLHVRGRGLGRRHHHHSDAPRANLPVAVQADGSPIVSRIRVEYPSDPRGRRPAEGEGNIDGYTLPLKGTDRFLSYETADIRTSHSTLTVRHAIGGRDDRSHLIVGRSVLARRVRRRFHRQQPIYARSMGSSGTRCTS